MDFPWSLLKVKQFSQEVFLPPVAILGLTMVVVVMAVRTLILAIKHRWYVSRFGLVSLWYSLV